MIEYILHDSTYIKYKNRQRLICAFTSKACVYSGGREGRLGTGRGHEGLWDTGCAVLGLGAVMFSLKNQWVIYNDDRLILVYVNYLDKKLKQQET